MRAFLILALLAIPTAAGSQQLNCEQPMSQAEMTGCAALDLERADDELNRVWKRAMGAARRSDADHVPDGLPSRATLLRDAQRKWIAYRDAACDAEATVAYGGTLSGQIHLMCKERLTRLRARDLLDFSRQF